MAETAAKSKKKAVGENEKTVNAEAVSAEAVKASVGKSAQTSKVTKVSEDSKTAEQVEMAFPEKVAAKTESTVELLAEPSAEFSEHECITLESESFCQCPLCGENVDNVFADYHRNQEEWALNVIRETNPDWVDRGGLSPKALEYYRLMVLGSVHAGEIEEES
jgi:hypothetical protein